MVNHSGYIVASIKFRFEDIKVDQSQSNALYGVKQSRIEVEGQKYRLIVAPIDAPIQVGGHPIDEHFIEDIEDEAWQDRGVYAT